MDKILAATSKNATLLLEKMVKTVKMRAEKSY